MTRRGSKHKKTVPRLDPDVDFEAAFGGGEPQMPAESGARCKDSDVADIDRNGIPVLENRAGISLEAASIEEPAGLEADDFATLLAQSFTVRKRAAMSQPKPVPLKKRLKRYPAVETELDLHGCTAMQAESRARSFILTCQRRGFFTIRIIVGKGRHSPLGPVLPDVVEDLAVQMRKEGPVLHFQWENKRKSTSGALVVYLRQFDPL